jgi:hypothetical protein
MSLHECLLYNSSTNIWGKKWIQRYKRLYSIAIYKVSDQTSVNIKLQILAIYWQVSNQMFTLNNKVASVSISAHITLALET